MDPSTLRFVVPAAGFALGCAFGAVAHRSGFCTMGAVSDVVLFGDWRRMRLWVLAMAVAILGAQAVQLMGWVALGATIYTAPRLLWASHLVGGALFGVGMTLASGCGNRNLVRLAAGNLKSLVVLMVLGLTAFATMRGVLAPIRVQWLDAAGVTFEHGQDLPAFLGEEWRVAVAVGMGAVLLAWSLGNRAFRSAAGLPFAGLILGAVVVGGWVVTGYFGYVAEDPETLESLVVGTRTRRPESLTFVGPVADTLELLLLWTDASLRVTFGVAVVAGTLVGAHAHARAAREFRWEGFGSIADLRNHVAGAALMGFGGVCALGCTVGQGLSGVSTLAAGAFLTVAGIVAGCAITLWWIYSRTEASALVDTPKVAP
jgi:hypothetical protein